MGIRFELLGPLRVELDGRPVPITGPKVRTLLALLLGSPGETVRVDSLLDLLWDGDPPRTGLASLHNHVNRLRTALGPYGTRVRSAPKGYRLSVERDELDLTAFTAAADRARDAHERRDWPAVAAETAGALALWRGEPFGDIPVLAGSPRAARLRETRLTLLERSFATGLRTGRHRDLVAELTALTAEHPLHEAFHAQLMLALHGSGRTAEALEVHRVLRAALAEELGVDPGGLVRDAHRELLAADSPPAAPTRAAPARTSSDHASSDRTSPDRASSATKPAAPHAAPPTAPAPAAPGTAVRVPHQLPRPASALIGRERELEQLTAALAAPREAAATDAADDADVDAAADAAGTVPVVVVYGMGGLGKTTLAVHAAHRLRTAFPDGQLYVDLNGYGNGPGRELRDVLARFLTDLGVDGSALPEHLDDRAALYRDRLARRRVLVVLDNAHDLTGIAPLIPGTGPSAVIVTTRRAPSGQLDAIRVPLQPLGTEGRDLLALVCGEDRVAAEPEAVERILAVCGGLPLAIRLAGGRIANRANWPLSVLADRLEEAPQTLELLTGDDTSVRAAFAMSYQALLEDDGPGEAASARAFRLLGVWPCFPLSPEVASALLGEPVDRTLDLLDTLVDAQMLQSPAPRTYVLHDLVAGYATELARTRESPQGRAAALDRLLAWYARAVHHAGTLCTPYWGDTEPVDGLAPSPAPLPRLASPTDALAWLRQEMPSIRAAVRRAGASDRPEPAWQIVGLLTGYGTSYWWEGHWSPLVTDALGLARAHGARRAEARLYVVLATIHGHDWDHAACLAHLATAEGIYAEEGVKEGLAMVLLVRALTFLKEGRVDEGLATAHRSIDLFRAVDGRDNPAAQCTLARMLLATGNAEEAERIFRRYLEVFRRELPSLVPTTLTSLGQSLAALGRSRDALTALAEALSVAEALDDHNAAAVALQATAAVHARAGRAAAARDCWTAALALARRAGLRKVTAESLAGLESLAPPVPVTLPAPLPLP
ncbi:BTAD domain-containing putative transcriptional regulator [Kitasatospora sp. NPDC056446]|uniref:AfsR/SARP family transcriptional regulator n=1 Tax=Kitasatospora sp. NPDC056446 TaxID=3345819 RepID=UPI00367B93C6